MTWDDEHMICPICKREVEKASPDFPFCSERCRLVDLGNWASGVYRVPAPTPESEDPLAESEGEENSHDKDK